jgi:hypothetical protein
MRRRVADTNKRSHATAMELALGPAPIRVTDDANRAQLA